MKACLCYYSPEHDSAFLITPGGKVLCLWSANALWDALKSQQAAPEEWISIWSAQRAASTVEPALLASADKAAIRSDIPRLIAEFESRHGEIIRKESTVRKACRPKRSKGGGSASDSTPSITLDDSDIEDILKGLT